MKIRKLGLFLILPIVTSLVSCNYGRQPYVPQFHTKFNGDLESERGAVLHILENDTAIELGYFKELLAAFNEKYAEYGITAVDANSDQYGDLANQGPYGYGPDVLYQANDIIMKYVKEKHVMPLPQEKIDAFDSFGDVAKDAYTQKVQGAPYLFGVPVNIQAPLLYYRKDLLPENPDANDNGTPDVVETWNNLYEYSKQIRESDGTKYGYMQSISDQYCAIGFMLTYGSYIFGMDNTDESDIGFSAGNGEIGAYVLRQLASVMNKDCIDDSVSKSRYSNIGSGTYFATLTTPDVKNLFINQMVMNYMADDKTLTEEEAMVEAQDNLVLGSIPEIPVNGNLSDKNAETIPTLTLGGVNGYAISSYTKYPNASLAFINFATSYEMIAKRASMLEITPARSDVADTLEGVTKDLFKRMENNEIVIMPSVSGIAQVWDPLYTFLSYLAEDPFRPQDKQQYLDLDSIKKGLKKVDQQIYDAIFTLE